MVGVEVAPERGNARFEARDLFTLTAPELVGQAVDVKGDQTTDIVGMLSTTATAGMAFGTSGNLSVRVDGGEDGGMLITPSGIAYATLQPADIVAVRFTGPGTADWPTGQHALDPSSEWLMHQAVYQARPPSYSWHQARG